MSDKFVAGIDGGGTKTLVLCWDLEGKEIAFKQFGAFNLNSIGQEAFNSLLSSICSYLNSLGQCKALCIGAAGISNKKMQELIALNMQQFGIENWKLVGDHEIALCGALDGKVGIGLIAGTGSICFGKSSTGTLERAGGWGHLIGDEGSGYRLGKDALAVVARAMDGYGEPTQLVALLAEKLNLKSRAEIISYVYSNDKSAVAAIAPLVDEACSNGDKLAKEIVDKNAYALVELAKAVAAKLEDKRGSESKQGPEKIKVALLGGLLANKTNLRETFIAKLSEVDSNLVCIDPIHNATIGAAMMALEMIK